MREGLRDGRSDGKIVKKLVLEMFRISRETTTTICRKGLWKNYLLYPEYISFKLRPFILGTQPTNKHTHTHKDVIHKIYKHNVYNTQTYAIM